MDEKFAPRKQTRLSWCPARKLTTRQHAEHGDAESVVCTLGMSAALDSFKPAFFFARAATIGRQHGVSLQPRQTAAYQTMQPDQPETLRHSSPNPPRPQCQHPSPSCLPVSSARRCPDVRSGRRPAWLLLHARGRRLPSPPWRSDEAAPAAAQSGCAFAVCSNCRPADGPARCPDPSCHPPLNTSIRGWRDRAAAKGARCVTCP